LIGKKVLVGEASGIDVVIELDSTPKLEHVIKISQKKPPSPPPPYKDTNISMTSKVSFPTWHNLYHKIYNGCWIGGFENSFVVLI
jgi:hypothetical protein